MLFNLLLANVAILSCFFFLISYCFLQFLFLIAVEIKNAKLKPTLAIPTGAAMTVPNDAIEMVPVVTDKAVSDLSR